MKKFDIPIIYRSPLISAIKSRRKQQDPMKKDFTPTPLDLGEVQIYLSRHFGFCYGVENAIDISFRTIEQNPGRRIFLLSEMIHNPQVNADLVSRGIRFLQDTQGKQLMPFDDLSAEDVVIVPAFGTTLEIEQRLRDIGIQPESYKTTCPFVEKVWKRSSQIAGKDFTVIVHGKPGHEETRATFSHAAAETPTVVVKDMEEARMLAGFIKRELALEGRGPALGGAFTEAAATASDGSPLERGFYEVFKERYSQGFDVKKDFHRIGVVNQTTMLASDTQAIADYLRQTMIEVFGEAEIADHFADTRDTLCYATLENQHAVFGLLDTPADLAIVVGGYNSSNTSHLVELCEERLPTYFISSEENILSRQEILHYDFHSKQEQHTTGWLTEGRPVRILVTSGASCPDALVEAVIVKIARYYGAGEKVDELARAFAD